MASVHPPVLIPHIEYYLEEHVSSVLEVTPLHVTYKAYDRASALIATASLLARGHQAQYCHVSHHNHTAWHVHAQH